MKKITKKDELDLYYSILRIRRIEEKIAKEYANWKIRCPVHLSIGQEAIGAPLKKIFSSNKDEIVSGHRAHAHYLGKGGDLKKFICEIYGKKNGSSGGKAGSMHLTDKKSGFILSSAIVGNSIPIGVGLAYSKKIKKETGVVLIFFGDAAVETGVFFESLNFAILKKLKVIFICENNFYSVYSNMKFRQPQNRKISKMAKGIGIKTLNSNGNDPMKVYKTYWKAKDYVTRFKKPIFLEFETFRHYEHCGFRKDDHLKYRKKTEIDYWLRNDCLKKLHTKVNEKKLINFEKKINKEIHTAFEIAKKSKFPSNSENKKKLYA
jgi:TPP-dependent pyruvate/acetoin dehydrogenase alpha subunit